MLVAVEAIARPRAARRHRFRIGPEVVAHDRRSRRRYRRDHAGVQRAASQWSRFRSGRAARRATAERADGDAGVARPRAARAVCRKDPRIRACAACEPQGEGARVRVACGRASSLRDAGAGRHENRSGERRAGDSVDSRRVMEIATRASRPFGGANVSASPEYDRYWYLDRNTRRAAASGAGRLNDGTAIMAC